MILFTGGGAIASSFSTEISVQDYSARKMTDAQLLESLIEATVVIHNAAEINCKDLETAVASNFLLSKRIIDLLAKHKPGVQFVQISSMSFLKTAQTYKDPEEMDFYAFSKYLAELYCLKSPLQNVCSVRFSTIFYGQKDKDGLSKLIATAVENKAIELLNGGQAKRDFLPLDSLIETLHELVSKPFAQKTINVASGKATSFKEAADLLKEFIPGLIITDKNGPVFPEVLSDFSSAYTVQGDVNLKTQIGNYLTLLGG